MLYLLCLLIARGAAGAKSVEQWVRKKAFNASKDGRRDIFTNIYRREWRIFAILARGAAGAKSVEQ